jgi:hypothetical protein
VTHFKDQTQTMLQYSQNISNAVYESVKRSVNWAAHYFTHSGSYYPVPHSTMGLQDLPKMTPLQPQQKLHKVQQTQMREWANEHGKCVRQRSVRQQTTMFSAGTLPLNMHKKENILQNRLEFPNGVDNVAPRAVLGDNEPAQDATPGAVAVHVDNAPTQDVSEAEHLAVHVPIDQVSEYDTDSDTSDTDVDADNQWNAALHFMRGSVTRSGRTIKLSHRFI